MLLPIALDDASALLGDLHLMLHCFLLLTDVFSDLSEHLLLLGVLELVLVDRVEYAAVHRDDGFVRLSLLHVLVVEQLYLILD